MLKSPNLNDNSTLPPNVRGKPRGFIELKITNIKWKDIASVKRYEKLEIILSILWWGQDKIFNKKLIYNTFKPFESSNFIKYTILTNCTLFHNYLINCEPIQISLFTKTSNYHIGDVQARIPLRILKGCNNYLTGEAIAFTDSQKYLIFSGKGVELGDININFKMMFYDQISERENVLNECNNRTKRSVRSDPDKEVEIITSSRSYKDFKEKTKTKPEKTILSSRIVNYLSGRQMSKRDEKMALNEIQRISPISSTFMEEICLKLPKSPDLALRDPIKQNEDFYQKMPKSPNLVLRNTIKQNEREKNKFNMCSCKKSCNNLDSIYLSIKYLKLLAPGVREVYVKSLVKTTFTVECKISSSLLDSPSSERFNYDLIRFYSNTFDDNEQRIDFNKDAIRKIRSFRNEGNENFSDHSDILFTIWWREYGSRYSRCLGTTKYRFTNNDEITESEKEIKLKIRSCTAGAHVADLYCKINLGSKTFSIGNEFPDKRLFSSNYENEVQFKENRCVNCCPSKFNHTFTKIKEIPNNQNCDSNGRNENANPVQDTHIESSANFSPVNSINNSFNNHDEKDQKILKVQAVDKNNLEVHNVLKGLLYVGEMKNLNNTDHSNYFCVVRAFWKDDPTSSGFSQNNNFNFLEIFSIVNDTKFLERVRNNILIVELWQKSIESHEKLFGIIRLPLHQFYIAFRDPVLANHLFKAKLPVISIDGLAPVVSPLSGNVCGHIQTLLCIGTEEQLNNLRHSRGFSFDCVLDNKSSTENSSKICIPQFQSLAQECNEVTKSQNCTFDVALQTETNANCINEVDNKTNKEKLSNILGNFLDNLTQKLPTPSSEATSSNIAPVIEQHLTDQQKTLKRTSDLLDILQKALLQPPNQSNIEKPVVLEAMSDTSQILKEFKLFLEIECALHLPRNPAKLISKKTSKRNKGKQSRYPPNEEPSPYVTFQANEGYGQMFKSHEGMVYATNVIEKSSNPTWGKRFEISLTTDFLIKDNKPFLLRVWKKAATDLAHCRLLPTPMEDSIIGVASIDLSVLMARIPFISGWYNIIDFSGKVNGQLKITIKPLEDVSKLKSLIQTKQTNVQTAKDISFLKPAENSNNPQLDSNDLGLGLEMDMSLSRAFKRKLVELEEINQRLRARLLDVTGEADPDIDLAEVDDEQMDEFERDLNTKCDEEEMQDFNVPVGQNDNFAWLDEKNFHIGDGDKIIDNEISKRNQIADTNCNYSNQEKIKIISEFLKNTEITSKNSDADNEQN